MLNDEYELSYLPLFYEEFNKRIDYIASNLGNPEAANDLVDAVEAAILKRLEDGPEIFEKVTSHKDRKHPYYRIYVKNYIIYYVVIKEDGKKIMEVRHFLHSLEDRDNKV